MDQSPLAILERAELAARERRLTASAEADRILAAADERVVAVEAAIPGRIQAALDGLRAAHDERAAAEVRVIDEELRALEAATPRGGSDRASAAAVDLVVAAVLGERPDPDPEARGTRADPVATARTD